MKAELCRAPSGFWQGAGWSPRGLGTPSSCKGQVGFLAGAKNNPAVGSCLAWCTARGHGQTGKRLPVCIVALLGSPPGRVMSQRGGGGGSRVTRSTAGMILVSLQTASSRQPPSLLLRHMGPPARLRFGVYSLGVLQSRCNGAAPLGTPSVLLGARRTDPAPVSERGRAGTGCTAQGGGWMLSTGARVPPACHRRRWPRLGAVPPFPVPQRGGGAGAVACAGERLRPAPPPARACC